MHPSFFTASSADITLTDSLGIANTKYPSELNLPKKTLKRRSKSQRFFKTEEIQALDNKISNIVIEKFTEHNLINELPEKIKQLKYNYQSLFEGNTINRSCLLEMNCDQDLSIITYLFNQCRKREEPAVGHLLLEIYKIADHNDFYNSSLNLEAQAFNLRDAILEIFVSYWNKPLQNPKPRLHLIHNFAKSSHPLSHILNFWHQCIASESAQRDITDQTQNTTLTSTLYEYYHRLFLQGPFITQTTPHLNQLIHKLKHPKSSDEVCLETATAILNSLANYLSQKILPTDCIELHQAVRKALLNRYIHIGGNDKSDSNNSEQESQDDLASTFFLRYICNAILTPSYWLTEEQKEKYHSIKGKRKILPISDEEFDQLVSLRPLLKSLTKVAQSLDNKMFNIVIETTRHLHLNNILSEKIKQLNYNNQPLLEGNAINRSCLLEMHSNEDVSILTYLFDRCVKRENPAIGRLLLEIYKIADSDDFASATSVLEPQAFNLRKALLEILLSYWRKPPQNLNSRLNLVNSFAKSSHPRSDILKFWHQSIEAEVAKRDIIEVTRNTALTSTLYEYYHRLFLQGLFITQVAPHLSKLMHKLKHHKPSDELFLGTATSILNSLVNYLSRKVLPTECVELHQALGKAISEKPEPEDETKESRDYVISMFFLRFLCNAILTPSYWLTEEQKKKYHPIKDKRKALLISDEDFDQLVDLRPLLMNLTKVSQYLQEFSNQSSASSIPNQEKLFFSLKKSLFR